MEKTSGNELVERLIKGSQEIDRMRKEIKQIIGMIMGFLKVELDYWENGKDIGFKSHICHWMIYKCKDELVIWCCILNSPDSILVTENGDVNTRNVEIVRNHALEILIEGILHEFPNVNNRLEPFFEAAKLK